MRRVCIGSRSMWKPLLYSTVLIKHNLNTNIYTFPDIFIQLCRYMKLLHEAVVAKLPFRFFKQNNASRRLTNRDRATEGDTQVQL